MECACPTAVKSSQSKQGRSREIMRYENGRAARPANGILRCPRNPASRMPIQESWRSHLGLLQPAAAFRLAACCGRPHDSATCWLRHGEPRTRTLKLELPPAQRDPAQHVVVPQQAASTKAAAGCRSPRWLRHGRTEDSAVTYHLLVDFCLKSPTLPAVT